MAQIKRIPLISMIQLAKLYKEIRKTLGVGDGGKVSSRAPALWKSVTT